MAEKSSSDHPVCMCDSWRRSGADELLSLLARAMEASSWRSSAMPMGSATAGRSQARWRWVGDALGD